MFDFLLIFILGLLGLLAHVARTRRWLEWILRIVIVTVAFLEGLLLLLSRLELFASDWATSALCTTALLTMLILFMPIRRLFSWLFTSIEFLITGGPFIPLIKKQIKVIEYFLSNKIFVPSSFPHLMALFIYINTAGYLLMSIEPDAFKMPYMPLPIPLMLLQLLSYNGIGLILLSFGVGVFVTRPYKDAFARLGWVKPTKKQVGIGILIVFGSFLYDAIWAHFTHHLPGQDLATKLSFYNSGTFTANGGLMPSAVLALMTALCAGIGEETLIRGALQPVFGIVPAAVLHGMLHGQFAHAPIFIIQVSIWSIMMGLVKRYTNTTTTIIGHAGFNLVTTFLFSFNP